MAKNQKPELDIENMSAHGEIVKMMLEDTASLNFEINTSNTGVTAALIIQKVDREDLSKFNKTWRVAPTKEFALKLIALLDAQSEVSDQISEALEEGVKEGNANLMAVKEAWGLLK